MYKKITYYLMAALVLIGAAIVPQTRAQAEDCPSLRVVFARGSGGERWTDKNYLAFKEGIEEKLKTVTLDYEFIDLDYPAIGIGVDKLGVTAGAYFGAGESYEFGKSVNAGATALKKMVNSSECPGTKYVLGGYSQGAMVVSKSLRVLKSDRVIYAATFGDPKIYLPEGGGLIPPACSGKNLSDYRMYVPDCMAYKGMLGAYKPYEPDDFVGKVGTWCNKRDFFCSSYRVMSDHTAYVAEKLYEDASRVIFDKICKAFELENHVSSPHDTAILIDSTGSMVGMINQYKAEALRLAKETLDTGGRVALFDYRDLDDPYDLKQHCDFETCTWEVFQTKIASIEVDGGGDTPESLMSASWHAMKALNWKQGSTKSLVVLTDANFHPSEKDGITLDKVVDLSKRIDPVNFYIITTGEFASDYTELAERTDGKVATGFGEVSLMMDYIIERYDSLPRVEEGAWSELPTLEVTGVEWQSETEVKVNFATEATEVMVALNDAVLGAVGDRSVTITGVDRTATNSLALIPMTSERKGAAVEVELTAGYGGSSGSFGGDGEGAGGDAEASAGRIADESGDVLPQSSTTLAPIPKAPDTGRR